ncbi:hypothetical protein V8G54_023396 [Vigna mungo]|uniref:Uncharacterized protein n=1 Tax=Vigna mungo TaxID=3915 RepID=A0AAQ3N545_VIGMU
MEIASHRDSAFVLAPPPNAIPCYSATINLHHFHPRTSQIVVVLATLPSNLHHKIVHHMPLLQITNRHSSPLQSVSLLASTYNHNQTCKQTRSQVQASLPPLNHLQRRDHPFHHQ